MNLVLIVAAVALAGWVALTLVSQRRRFSNSRVSVRAGR
jgi:hypothetical protein